MAVIQTFRFMDELEKLYDELPYFDKQHFLKKHLGDVKPEDLDEFIITEDDYIMAEIVEKLGYDDYTYFM